MRITFMSTVVCENHHPIISLVAECEIEEVAATTEWEEARHEEMEQAVWLAFEMNMAAGECLEDCGRCGSKGLHVHVERVPNVPEAVSKDLRKKMAARDNALTNPN